MSKMMASIRAVIGINVAVVAVCVAMILTAYNLEKPDLTFPSLPLKLADGRQFRAGDAVPLLAHRCNAKSEEIVYPLTHKMISVETGEVVMLSATTINVDAGCTSATSKVNVIPKDTKPGHYYFAGFALIPGVIRNTFNVRWYSETFEVIP